MAELLSVEELRELKKQNPDHTVVAYINTTAELKGECDVCVTSASALQIVKNLPSEKVLFIPDPNLGQWVKNQVPEKSFRFIEGGCPIHTKITAEEVQEAKALHPKTLLLVHPECRPEVTAAADYAGSTTGILKYVKNSPAEDFIIGTENSIVQHLQFDYPEKKFYPLSKTCICNDMKLTTLTEVYNCLLGRGGEEILLPETLRKNAQRAIDAMLEYGK